MQPINTFLLLMMMTLAASACTRQGDHKPDLSEQYKNTTVLQWNDATAVALRRGGDLPPMTESRIYAMVNVAMHDALNNIVKNYSTYALTGVPDHAADPDAAVAQAAHDVLVNLVPSELGFADSLLSVNLNAIQAGAAKEKGIVLGRSSAAAMLAKRLKDGATSAQYAVVQGTLPGQYQSTPPFIATGFALFPGWGKVLPFSLTTSTQFRPGAPYAINSPQYTADYNEIKTMGAVTGSSRSADQTELGVFWLENVPASWNRIARTLIAQHGLDAWKTAQLLAILNMAEADVNVAIFDSKYYYNFWRPITAVRLADSDGNPETTGNTEWNILGKVTPPVPDYPSNHAADGGAAAELLKLYFGRDDFTFTTSSTSMPGTPANLPPCHRLLPRCPCPAFMLAIISGMQC